MPSTAKSISLSVTPGTPSIGWNSPMSGPLPAVVVVDSPPAVVVVELSALWLESSPELPQAATRSPVATNAASRFRPRVAVLRGVVVIDILR